MRACRALDSLYTRRDALRRVHARLRPGAHDLLGFLNPDQVPGGIIAAQVVLERSDVGDESLRLVAAALEIR